MCYIIWRIIKFIKFKVESHKTYLFRIRGYKKVFLPMMYVLKIYSNKIILQVNTHSKI